MLVYDAALDGPDRQALESYLLAKHPSVPVPPAPTFTDVFVSGAGYHTFRIPSILTTGAGTLLAFAEGRQSTSDHAQNDIVMRRSTDGGASWGPLVTLHDDGGNSLNNPCVVEVREGVHAGRIVLMHQRYPQGCHESCVVPGYTGPNVCRNFQMHSDDDGLTWTAPVENTMQVKRPTVARSIASGPGIGIQKRRPPHAGRLVMPFNQGSSGWQVYAAFSDDGGDTWAWGALADDTQSPGNGNEVQVAELPDGSLLLNSRSAGGTHHRKVARSFDGGASWTPLLDDGYLIEPQVMASIHVLTDPLDGFAQSRLLYAGPWSQSSRSMGTVLLSYDGGLTWPHQRLLWPSFYAYSVLTVFPEGDVGCLFERSGYGAITLARFDLGWLTDGADCLGEGPEEFCGTSPNSAGPGATLSSSGTPRLDGNDFTLAVGGAPPGQFGLFFFGREAASFPLGDGVLCIGLGQGGLHRLPVVQMDALGTAWHDLDVTLPPGDEILAGSSTFFQFWYRDPQGPGGTGVNFSDGVRVVFCR
ncbi:MAG: exo-alpha-sialidase [bacterium]|nr:exo-alpha-sialidase [bacterium]